MSNVISHSIIDKITIEVFYDVLQTGNLERLGAYENPQEVWLDTFNDYCLKAKVDNTNIKQYGIVESLKLKYSYILTLLNKLRYSHYLLTVDGFKQNKDRIVKELRSKGYLFNDSKDFEEELNRLITQSDSLKMKIVIEDGKIDKTQKKISFNLWKDLVNLQRTTNISLDPRVDVMGKLIEVRNIANDIIKQSNTK